MRSGIGRTKVFVIHRNGTADGRQCSRVAESGPVMRRGTGGGARIDIRVATHLRTQHVQMRADLADADIAQRLEPVGDGQVQTKHAVHVDVIATGGHRCAQMRQMTMREKFRRLRKICSHWFLQTRYK